MKRTYISNIMSLVLVGSLLWSCQPEQDVEPVDSPDDNPVATIEPVATVGTSVNEGDTLMYSVTLDNFVAMTVDWSTVINESSTADLSDIAEGAGSVLSYTEGGLVPLVIVDDRFPEASESLQAEINASEDIGYNWQLNPNSDSEVINLTINNVNRDDALTIGLRWADDHDDWDLIIEQPDASLSFDAATGSDPEVNETTLTLDAPDGEYLILIDPFEVEATNTEFELNYAMPDGSVSENKVSFSGANSEDYTTSQGYFVIGTVTKAGNNFTVNVGL